MSAYGKVSLLVTNEQIYLSDAEQSTTLSVDDPAVDHRYKAANPLKLFAAFEADEAVSPYTCAFTDGQGAAGWWSAKLVPKAG